MQVRLLRVFRNDRLTISLKQAKFGKYRNDWESVYHNLGITVNKQVLEN